MEKEEKTYRALELYSYEMYKKFIDTYFYKEVKSPFFKTNKILNQLKGKEFIDFLVDLEKQYNVLYKLLLTLKYNYEYNLGRILELNAGLDTSVAVLDQEKHFDFTVVSLFSSKEVFGEQYFDYYKGRLSSINIIDEDSIKMKELYLKYYDEEKILELKDFSTILNINPSKVEDIFNTMLYGIKNNKTIITGYTSSYYDIKLDEKMDTMDYVKKELENYLNKEVYESENTDNGCKVRVLTNYRNY